MPDAVDGVYLGVDVGTSATRVSLVRPGGHAVVASAGYRTARAGHGRVEQDPAAWSRALAAALRRLIAHGADLSEVGLCGQTPTLIPVDARIWNAHMPLDAPAVAKTLIARLKSGT